LEYNKKNQPYDILDRFHITENNVEVEYCRVKFAYTKHIQIVKADLVKTGDFEDHSLLKEPVEDETTVIKLADIEEIEEVEEHSIDRKIIATNPKGKEVEVENLEQFCEDNKLDIEVVKAVLEGKQKTHRKFKFRYA
jgi:hypothetical protein